MSDPTPYLTSLAQALARMSLYAEGHPARAKAADASFAQLRELQKHDPRPAFSFLGREAVYANRAIRGLSDWDWAERLASSGIQRIEFSDVVDSEEYRAFLDDVLKRIALIAPLAESPDATRQPQHQIRFGAIGVRGGAGEHVQEEQHLERMMQDAVDLSEEADLTSWVHHEVLDDRALHVGDAEAVVRALAVAMHTDRRVFLPLVSLKEFDQYTTTHALNVSVLAMGLAEYLGLSPREARSYGMAGLLHDIGKVKVPHEILRKPGGLTPEELEVMRKHPVDGARIILESKRPIDVCAVVAFEHHVMIDGTGYPAQRSRQDCHHASMLVHVCDVYDALRTHRPYRVGWPHEAILAYIERRIGSEFEADVAKAFIAMMREWGTRTATAAMLDAESLLPAW
jgi:putative nucleotidyltransferase with HDIG domain